MQKTETGKDGNLNVIEEKTKDTKEDVLLEKLAKLLVDKYLSEF